MISIKTVLQEMKDIPYQPGIKVKSPLAKDIPPPNAEATQKHINKTPEIITPPADSLTWEFVDDDVLLSNLDGHPHFGPSEPNTHALPPVEQDFHKNHMKFRYRVDEARSMVGTAAPNKKAEERHVLFKKNEQGEWEHHYFAPTKEDADDEMKALKNNRYEAIKLMAPKKDNVWIKSDPHSYVMARLNTPVDSKFDGGDPRGRNLSGRTPKTPRTPPAAGDLHTALTLAHKSGKSLKMYWSDKSHFFIDPITARRIVTMVPKKTINAAKSDDDIIDLVTKSIAK